MDKSLERLVIMRFSILIFFVHISLALMVFADQPIMNKMPRWSEGYGIQFIQEYRHESDLLLGKEKVGKGLTEDVEILNIEGVYTWERWIRMTAKLPYVFHAERELFDSQGNVTKQTDQGFGDLTLAIPLKNYFNLDGRSGSWTLAPQFRIPLAGDDEYEIWDGDWGTGFSFGYETETVNWFLGIGVNTWFFEDDKSNEAGSFFDIGLNLFGFGSSGQITWETDYKWENDGSYLLKSGPAIYWKFSDTVHGRVEWKKDYIDRRGVLDHGNGDIFKIGIGFVY